MSQVKLGWGYNLGLTVAAIFKSKTAFRNQFLRHLQNSRFEYVALVDKCENEFHNEYLKELNDCEVRKKNIDSNKPIATKEYIEDYIYKVKQMPVYKEALDKEKAEILKPLVEKIKEFDEKIAHIKLNQEVINDFSHVKNVQDKFY